MRAFRRFYLVLILALSYSVLFSATGHTAKAPYKACLSRMTRPLKLAGLPESGREMTAALPAAKPLSDEHALLLLGFAGFGLRGTSELPSVQSAPLARVDLERLGIAPQRDPFILRI